MKKSKLKSLAKPAVSLLLFALIIVWLLTGLDNTSNAADTSKINSVRKSVMNSAVLCYSIEGTYPADIDYLIENYGVRYDEDEFIVVYDYFGGNVRPTVTVIAK